MMFLFIVGIFEIKTLLYPYLGGNGFSFSELYVFTLLVLCFSFKFQFKLVLRFNFIIFNTWLLLICHQISIYTMYKTCLLNLFH